jgi:glycosyltransferase involved in cell wall biosynthesis
VPVRQTDALAQAVAALVRDPALRGRMGQAARRKAAAEFDQRRVIATTLEVYRDVLAARRLPTPRRGSRRLKGSSEP